VRRGTTLLEMIVVVAVLAAIAAIAVPLVADRGGARLAAAETLLRDDLEQARHRTIADPARAVMLLLDADGRGWRLADADDRSPIERIDGAPWTVRFGEGPAEGLDGMTVTRDDDPTARALRFDADGTAILDAPARYSLHDGQRDRSIEVGVVTGLVRTVESDRDG
jgi:prepilin-type N-terminal cleavage/methylation domain-containing protein